MRLSTSGPAIRNRLFISGMSLEEFKDKYFSEDNFDLNRVVRFPNEYPDGYTWDDSSDLYLYLCALCPKVSYKLEGVDKMNGNAYNAFLKKLKERNFFMSGFVPDDDCFKREKEGYITPIEKRIGNAKNQLSLYEKYGAISAMEWAFNNWGSASLAFPTLEDSNSLIFDTLLLPPIKAIVTISKANPRAVFFMDFASEDEGFDCGFVILKDGCYIKSGFYDDHGDEAMKLYKDVFFNYEMSMDKLYEKKLHPIMADKGGKDGIG